MKKHKLTGFLLILVSILLTGHIGTTYAQSLVQDADEPVSTPTDSHAPATIYTVNNSSDADDGNCTSLHCTLREAINAANGHSGHDTIRFNFFSVTSILPNSELPDITDPVTIDGITGNGSSCPTSATTPANLNVTLSGINAGTTADGLTFTSGSDGSTIKGLNIVNYDRAGIWLFLSDDHTVVCNQIGMNNSNFDVIGNHVYGILIHGDNNEIGGTAVADRNVISNNGSAGIRMHDTANSNIVMNNYIGTNREGSAALGAQDYGVRISGNENYVGGLAVGSGNVISGNDIGVYIYNAAPISDNGIFQNLIGLDQTGNNPVPNTEDGIQILGGASSNTVGGLIGLANTIAFNAGNGIMLDAPAAAQNVLRFNSIYANGGLGIDLDDNGVTANDNPDDDIGPNKLQNYPDLTVAEQSGRVIGTFVGDNVPAQDYDIDVYLNDSCDSSGHGEGKTYVESFTLTSWGNVVSFDFGLNNVLPLGKFVTMTATDPIGNTSEFSQCVAVTETIFVVNTTATTDDAVAGDNKCDIAGASSDCSLRAAVQEVNALAGGPYKIYFDLPAGSIIRPTSSSPVPTITKPVIIDAVTNNGTAACPYNKFVTIQGNLQGAPTVDGLVLGVGSDGSTIRGLAITRFTNGDAIQVDSANNKVVCNNLGVEADGTTGNANNLGLRVLGDNNVIGGATAVDRNLISANSSVGIYLQPSADSNDILGNYIGLDATGDADLGNGSTGLQIDGFFNTVGSAVAGSGNVISANMGSGIFLRDTGGNNTVVGNIIGLNKDGSLSAVPVSGNSNDGIYVISNNNLIGGVSAAHRNLISNNGGHGIYILAANSTKIKANYIGTDITGTNPVGNAKTGIRIEQGDDSIIGGDTAVEGNLVAANQTTGIFLFDGVVNTTIKNNTIGLDPIGFGWGNTLYGLHLDTFTSQALVQDNLITGNGRDGIRVDATAVLNDIYRNNISGNGWLGIDIDENGANNPAVPVSITSYDTGSNKIEAALNGDPNTTYRVDFFSSNSCDASGYGEGETYINSLNITTNGAGIGSDTLTGATFANGDYLTATATDTSPANETSEFSACVWVNACDTSNPLLPTIAIVNGGNDIQLNWLPDPTAQLYLIYRGINTPYDLGPGYTSTNAVPWVDGDSNEVGDVAENHYYGIVVRRACGDSVFSKTIGEFDFGIVPGS